MGSRLWLVLALAGSLFTLAGCDAGHRGAEGSDNLSMGPQLAVQVPGHDTVIDTQTPRLQFHLRSLTKVRFEDASVYYAIDDGPFKKVEDPTTWVQVEEPLVPGTHLITAYVADDKGVPYPGPTSVAASTFHVQIEKDGQTLGGRSSDHGYKTEGEWKPFDPHGPTLVVVPAARGVMALVRGATLDGETWRVRATGAEETLLGADTPHGGPVAGAIKSVVLEHRASAEAEWAPALGGRVSWSAP